MNQTITFDDISSKLVSITDLRRNAGSILDRLPETGTLTVLRDGKVAGFLTPNMKSKTKSELTAKQRVKIARKLAGSHSFKTDLTPKKLNEEYDKQYAEMLPR